MDQSRSWRGPGVYRMGNGAITVTVGTERTRKKNKIAAAIQSGEILRCVYFGGASAGAEREIVPVSLQGNDVWVDCLSSGQRKHYKLHRMKLLEEWEDASRVERPEDFEEWENRKPPAKFGSVADIRALHGAKIEALGWEIIEREEALVLQRGAGDAPQGGVTSICLEFDDAKGKWVVARAGKRRIWRKQLKWAANKLMEQAEIEARVAGSQVSVAAQQKAVDRSFPSLRIGALSTAALLLGAALGLLF